MGRGRVCLTGERRELQQTRRVERGAASPGFVVRSRGLIVDARRAVRCLIRKVAPRFDRSAMRKRWVTRLGGATSWGAAERRVE